MSQKKVIDSNGTRKKVKTGESIKAYPPVVTEEVFYAAQASITNRKQYSTGRPCIVTPNFFKGLIHCGVCGGHIRMSWSKSSGRYECKQKYTERNKCSSKCHPVSKVQKCLFYGISLFDNNDIMEHAKKHKSSKLRKEIETIKSEINDKQNRVENLGEAIEMGSKIGLERMIKLEEEILTLTKLISSKEQEIKITSSPFMKACVNEVNIFHRKFALGKISKDDQEPINNSLRNFISNIAMLLPENSNQRAIFDVSLLTDVKAKIVIYKDFSCAVYRGRKRVGFLDAE